MRAREKGSTRQHPKAAEQRDGCTEKGECREDRGKRAHPERVGGVRDNDRPGEYEQGLREPPQPLPFAPDERLETQPLAASGVHVAALDGTPLDDDVAGEADVQGEESAGNPAHQRPAAEQPGPVHLTQPAGGQHRADHQHQCGSDDHDQAEPDADGVRQAEAEPPGRHAHHAEQGTDAEYPEDVSRHARQDVPLDALLCGSEGN
jgi:hypothetical protein